MKSSIFPLTFFFLILSCIGPYIYGVHTEGGGWVRGRGLEIWHVFTNWQIYCSFLQMGSGLGVKNCWQLILKVTSIKKNAFSFSLLQHFTRILYIKFLSWEYLKELHQHSIYCALRKNVTEVYLEPSLTSMMEILCENSSRLILVNYFCKKGSIADVRLGSRYASGLLGAPYEMIPLNSFLLTYLHQNQFVFRFQKWKHCTE